MEYIIIYGSSTYRTEPFILAVTNEQRLINQFKEDFYYICHDYKIKNDNNFDMYSDYHVTELYGRCLTQKMLTSFYDQYMDIYGIMSNMIDLDLDIFRWDDNDSEDIISGLGIIDEKIGSYGPVDIEDMIYEARVLLDLDIVNIEKLLDEFIINFEISEDY